MLYEYSLMLRACRLVDADTGSHALVMADDHLIQQTDINGLGLAFQL